LDRLNHVKIVTPDPEAVDRFLREVLDIPAGWPLGEPPVAAPAALARSDAQLSPQDIERARGVTEFSGFITGSPESRQFQLLKGDKAHIWAVVIGTRHLERAHQRCTERAIACTEPAVTVWGDGSVRYFFAEVGGILFEIMRSEPAVSSSEAP
jgi:catechol 2,3-dioxygenase-like lactoylglutathione lyase family enzyme